GDWYQGSADATRQNLQHFGEDWDEILILCGDQLYHMDFQAVLANHRATGADASICALPVSDRDATSMGIMQLDDTGRIVRFVEKPPADKLKGLESPDEIFERFGVDGTGRPYLASMGIYVFNKRLLYNELRAHKHVDFGKDLFPAVLNKCRVQPFVFDGYWEDIGTVKSFHEANLAMTQGVAPFEFRTEKGVVYTRSRTLPATKAIKLETNQSIVSEGCVIKGAKLDNSILGLRSIVGENVRLKRCVVMGADYYENDAQKLENRRLGRPDVGFGDNIEIENAIVDKNARIGSNVVIKNPEKVAQQQSDAVVVRDGVICVVKNAVIPSGTKLGV
ncbi:MAG TPA: sugar phosphate nucleotidyltransferase, partial [Pirellulales bacterium]